MKVTTEQLEDCLANVTIEVDDETMRPALERAARKISSRFQIPGFRKGRAPYDVVKRLAGEEYLCQEAIEEIGPSLVERALKEQEIEPYGQPELTKIELKPVRLTVSVPLEPKVQLGDYRAIHIERPSAQVSDEDVQKALDSLRRSRARREPIDRPLQVGDLVTGRLRVRVEGENETEEPEDEDTTIRVPSQDEEWLPGISEHLVGAKVGDVIRFDTIMPEGDEDAGKPAHVTIEIHKAEEEILPELNDEFAVMAGDYDNLEALTRELREQLEREAKERAEAELQRKALDALVEGATIKYPAAAVEMEMDRLVANIEQQLKSRRISLEAYLKAANTTREELRERQRATAERNLRDSLVMREFVRAEGIEVTDEEMRARTDRAVNSLAAGDRDWQEYLRSPQFQARMESNMLFNRGMRRLISIVTGEPEPEEPTLPPEEMPAPPVSVVEVSEGEEQPITPEEVAHE